MKNIAWTRGELKEGDLPFAVKTLRGIDGVAFVTDYIVDGAELLKERVHAEATGMLKEHGINILSDEGLKATPGFPALYLRLSGSKVIDFGPGLFLFRGELRLVQAVRLVRDSSISTMAATWNVGVLAATLNSQFESACLEIVQKLTDKFVEVWRRENGTGSSEQ